MHDDNGVYVDAVDVNIPVPEAGMTVQDLKNSVTVNSPYSNVTVDSVIVDANVSISNSTPLVAGKRYTLLITLRANGVGEHDSFFTVGGTAIVNGVADGLVALSTENYKTCWVGATIICGGDGEVNPIETLVLVPEKSALKVGESTKINVYAYPENHTEDTIVWSKYLNSACFDWDEETLTVTAKEIPSSSTSYIMKAVTTNGNVNTTCKVYVYDGTEQTYRFTAKDTLVNTNGDYLPATRDRNSTVCIYPDYTKVPKGCILTGYTITDSVTGALVDIKVTHYEGLYDGNYWLEMPARNITATPIYTPTESGNVSGTIYSNGVLADMIQTTLTNTSTGKVRKLSLTGENGKAFEFKNVEAGTYQLEVTKAGHKDYLTYLDVNGDQERSITLYQLVPQALITIGGTMSGGTAKVTVEGLADGVSATIIVGQYSGGKLLDARTQTITGPDTYSVSGFASVSGATYKVFLVNRGGAPLCEAKSLA